MSLPPGPRLPPALQRLAWAQRPVAYASDCRRRYGTVFTLRFGGGLTLVLVADPRLAEELLTADPALMRRGPTPSRRTVLGATSVTVLDGEEHARRRGALAPSLASPAVAAHEEAIAAIVAQRVGTWPRGVGFRLLEPLRDIASDVLLCVVLGLGEGTERAAVRAAYEELARARRRMAPSVPLLRRRWGPGVASSRIRVALAGLDELLLDLIARRRDEARSGRADVVSTLLGADVHLGDRELRDQIVTLLLTGHDPLLSALAWTFERVVRRRDVMDRLRTEGHVGGPFAEAVVRETLRLRPASWLTGARTTTGRTEFGGHELPPGTMVTACVPLLHHDPDSFPEPTTFRPERFLAGGPDCRYVPFGGGHRRCPADRLAVSTCALALRTAVATLDLRPVDPRPELQRESGAVFLPAAGAKVIARAMA